MKRMQCMLWIIVLAALAVGTASADFLDEFNSTVLDPRWRIQGEDPTHWSLTARPGFLRIMTQYFDGNNMRNWFGHFEAINGNFAVSAKLIARPDYAGQLGAVWAAPDTFLSGPPPAAVGYAYDHSLKGVFGMINDTISYVPYTDTLVYLRIRTRGDTVFTEYSPNNSTWTVLRARWNPPFNRHGMSGFMAMNAMSLGATPQTPAMNADYDWYHLVAVTGIDEEDQRSKIKDQKYRITPNPFASFGAALGHEREDFAVYDIAGKMVGVFRGDRIGIGLAAGVYFIKAEDHDVLPVRVVKVR